MSANPGWMDFADDGLTGGPPLSSAGGDPFSSPHDDVPSFLQGDVHALGPSVGDMNTASAPSFLSGFPPAEAQPHVADPLSAYGAAADASRAARPLSAAMGEHGSSSKSTAVMYADQPSAAVLSFHGDSTNPWELHRVRILGKGNYGCATLYSLDACAATAEATTPTRAVVVKDINVQTMLNPQEDMPAVQNELRVLRCAAGHPNLVQYVDALFDSRPPTYPMCFILMEYAAGGDLAALLERCGSSSIPEEHLASYLIQTAVALQSLHTEHGILHRDVKPHNVFLLEDGLTVRLGDFGIAMQLGRVGDKAKEACGSPYFMAPEIFEEKPYDSAADVWSLGVVFYQLVAHQLPFTASSVAALGTLVRRGQFARLTEAASGVATSYSKELRELVDSMLTVDTAARPTLRRVLRSRYVREHLRFVPASVLTAKKPMPPPRATSAGSPRATSSGGVGATVSAVVAPQFSEEALYASVFGADAVADAVAHAAYPGVVPIVHRIVHA